MTRPVFLPAPAAATPECRSPVRPGLSALLRFVARPALVALPARPALFARPALVALALAAFISSPASAQPTRADSAAVLLAAATDFADRGDSELAEALYRHILESFAGTPAAQAARTRFAAASTERSRAGGETELKVWATTYGIWLGIAVPTALGADGPEAYGAGLLLGAPAGFLGSRAYGASRPVSLGQARAITWGGTWGAFNGMALAMAMDLGGGERIVEGDILINDPESDEAVFTAMIAGSALGIWGGMRAGRREIRPGTATSATLGTLWGAWFGLSAATLADLTEDEAWATTALAGDAGLLAGALAGSHWEITRSRARLISVGGLIGAVGAMGVLLLMDQDFEDDIWIAVPMAGSVLGLAGGAALTRNTGAEDDPSEDAGAMGALGTGRALLNWSGSDWSLAAPMPMPVRTDARTGDGRRGGVGWRVPLLHARF